MKFFGIGDGNKRIQAPERYFMDFEGDSTAILWDEHFEDYTIRITLMEVTPTDPLEDEAIYWDVIRRATSAGRKPLILGKQAVDAEPATVEEPGFQVFFYRAGVGNLLCLLSLTVSDGMVESAEVVRARNEILGMLESLEIRDEGEIFTYEIPGFERDKIQEETTRLIGEASGEAAWDALQLHYDKALDTADDALAGTVGMVFGELLCRSWEQLHWSRFIDDEGLDLVVQIANSGTFSFPIDVILKRFERGDAEDLAELALSLIEVLREGE